MTEFEYFFGTTIFPIISIGVAIFIFVWVVLHNYKNGYIEGSGC